MFESDDYDQVLSQLDFPEASEKLHEKYIDLIRHENEAEKISNIDQKKPSVDISSVTDIQTSNYINSNLHDNRRKIKSSDESPASPTHIKRKMMNSYFDHKSKRKFPGPAGLLTGSIEEKKDETICQVEFQSQNTNFTNIYSDVFETSLWTRLLEDTKGFNEIDTIEGIKQQASVGNLQKQKAHIVTAFVESVDRSAVDPFITLRDKTGHMKCTLHRDAWSSFSPYIVAEYCALVIWKPTVLTAGCAFKKHYLNITLSNIWAIYSSAIINEGETLSNGFQKICEEDYTIIKMDKSKSDGNFSTESEGQHESCDDLDTVLPNYMF